MANTKKCMIIGASPLKDGAVFQEFDPAGYYVICADGGYETALKYGITPDYIVGDFDSSYIKPDSRRKNVKVLPVEKDVTDTMAAACVGLKLDCREFVLIGCLGGARYDHTMANYNVMLYLVNKGCTAVMAEESSKVFLLRGNRLTLQGMRGCTVSVFPFGTYSCNVSYQGLKYSLREHDLVMGDTLMGVSNEILEDTAEIRVHLGSALVIVLEPRR